MLANTRFSHTYDVTIYFKPIQAVFTIWRCCVQSARKFLDYA